MASFGIEKYYSDETFNRLQLTGEIFSEIEFEKCTFEKCSFVQTAFVKCKFIDCLFQGCMLSAVDMKGCVFLETAFENSKIMGIQWFKVEKVRAPRFEKCDMELCGFSHMNLKEIIMKNSVAKECNFMESDCTGGDFEGTDFQKSIFQQTNLTEASFKRAFNYAIDFNANTLKKAKFSLPEAVSLLSGLDIVIED